MRIFVKSREIAELFYISGCCGKNLDGMPYTAVGPKVIGKCLRACPEYSACADPNADTHLEPTLKMSAPPRTAAWAVSSPRALRLVCSWLLVFAACLGTAQGEF